MVSNRGMVVLMDFCLMVRNRRMVVLMDFCLMVLRVQITVPKTAHLEYSPANSHVKAHGTSSQGREMWVKISFEISNLKNVLPH